MNLSNPIQPALINPKGVDINIETIRVLLSDISWIERSFGRAVAQYKKRGEKLVKVPEIPLGKGEYFSCMPNDTQKAFAWFYPVGASEAMESEPFAGSRYFTERVDLYIWANLERIDSTNLGLGEQLKDNVLKALKAYPRAKVLNIWSDDVEQVYGEWEVDHVGRDLLMWPYYAMRFELEMSVIRDIC